MVTKMAKNMVTKYGMSLELGTIAYGENEEEVFRKICNKTTKYVRGNSKKN